MSELIELNAARPEPNLLKIITDSLDSGAVIAYPTDSGYALGARAGLHKPLKRIQTIRELDDQHHYSLICTSLSEIAEYAKVDTWMFRILKRALPGGYTFVLPASSIIPKILQTRKKTIGIRMPDHPIPLEIAQGLTHPLLSTSLILPNHENPLIYPEDVAEHIGQKVDLIIDGGYCGFEATTVIDLSNGFLDILRHGSGSTAGIE